MKKLSIYLILILSSYSVIAQTGINTGNPKATFHIDGAKDNPLTGNPSVLQQTNDFVITNTGTVGIGTINPDSSASLDIKATNKGILIPRITLLADNDVTTIPNPAVGLTVYHLGNGNLRAGIYTNTGTSTVPFWSDGQTTTPTDGRNIFKLVYTGVINVSNPRSLQAGMFEWRVVKRPDNNYLEIRLRAQPTANVSLIGSRVGFVYTTVNAANYSKTWTPSNWNTWQTVEAQASGAAHEAYLECVGYDTFYKLYFYSRTDAFTAIVVEVL